MVRLIAWPKVARVVASGARVSQSSLVLASVVSTSVKQR